MRKIHQHFSFISLLLAALLTACGGGDTQDALTPVNKPPGPATGTPPPPDGTGLVINEIDYDQPGTDTAEFVEIYNNSAGSIDLGDYQLQFINGTSDAVYMTVPLSGSLAAGAYFVLGTASVNHLDLELTSSIQNGAPDGIRLERTTGELVDSLTYEGNLQTAGDGGGTSLADDGTQDAVSLCRVPNGSDTDDNTTDFALCVSTPGVNNQALP